MKQRSSPVRLGEMDKSVEVKGFVLTQTVRPPGTALPRHYHEHANIALATGGCFIETIGQQAAEVSPGSLILRPAGEVHANRYGREKAHCLVIEVKPERLALIGQCSDVLERAAHHRRGLMPVFASRPCCELRAMDTASPLAVEALILEVLTHAVRQHSSQQTPGSHCLREARDFIHAHFARNIGLAGIAAASGVHPSHLAKMFRRHYGCTVGEYLRRLRLEFAARELALSNRTLGEIALAAGFYDQSHFTNAFRRRFGLTPSAYPSANQQS